GGKAAALARLARQAGRAGQQPDADDADVERSRAQQPQPLRPPCEGEGGGRHELGPPDGEEEHAVRRRLGEAGGGGARGKWMPAAPSRARAAPHRAISGSEASRAGVSVAAAAAGSSSTTVEA